MDPTGITQIVGLLKALGESAKGVNALREKFKTETGRFWKEFKSALENDPDVPWPEIQSRCDLQPEFFGLMLDLALGMPGADGTMREFFDSFVEPPPNGRYDKSATVDRIMRAAEKAAVAAIPERDARDLATRRLLLSKIEAVSADVKIALESVDDRLAGTDAVVAEIAGVTAQILAHIEASSRIESTGPQGSVDEERMQALLEAQTSQLDERADKRVDELFDRLVMRSSPDANDADAGERTARARASLPAASGDHLARLRESDGQAADDLERRLAQDGAAGVADAITQRAFDRGPADLLVAAARVVANDGFFSQAEQAYLRAADLTESEKDKARQYVRAAQMASIQGADDRHQRHLHVARELDAAHPALLIVEARASSDSQFMLDHVANVVPENRSETALLHQTRAQAWLALGDEAAAQEEFDKARAADPENEAVREFSAILPWFRAQRQMEKGQSVTNADSLTEAAHAFEQLANDVMNQGRVDEAALIFARAAQCRLFADQHEEAVRTLKEIPDPRRLSIDAATGAAEIALLAAEPDLARRFIPAGATDERSRLILADALTQSDDPDDRTQGTAELQKLMTSGETDVASSASFALLVAATIHTEIPWNDEAARRVASIKPDAPVLLKAEYEALHDNFDEAQQILLPHSDRPTALRRLRDYAAMAGQWGLARDRSQALLRQNDDPRDRLAVGEALRQLGEPDNARVAFAAVANDLTAPPALRDAAYGSMIDLASVNRDYEAILQLAREWRTAIPDSRGAAWNEAFALARLSRHPDAWALIQHLDLDAETESQATLLGEVLYRAAPPEEAADRLVALSDRFNREVEALETLIIATALDAPPGQRTFSEPTEARIEETFASFPERFPDSHAITAFPAPKTPDEFEAFLRELEGDAPKLRQDAALGVEQGSAPVNLIAALSNGGVGQAWLQLGALPLGFATEGDLDGAAARAAIGGAAIWDSSALAINCLIEESTADRMRTFLPGSTIVTETLEDADAAARMPGNTWGRTVHLPSGGVGIQEISDDEREREQTLNDRLLAIARTLEVVPSRDNDSESQLLSLWEESGDRPEFRVLFGTLLVAIRTGRPIYSDDRFVRAGARSVGLKAFGTLALVDVLAERNLIDDDARRAVRRNLGVRGGWGVQLSGDELTEIASEADFDLAPKLRSALHDRARWRAHPGEMCQDALALLKAVQREAPQNLPQFLQLMLKAARAATPEVHSWMWLEMVLLLAWFPGNPPAVDDRCLQALLDAARALPPDLKPVGYDPIVHPFQSMLNSAPTRRREVLSKLFWLHLRRLRLVDQTRVLYEVADFDVRPSATPGL